jgi:hypothetical protein
MRSMVSDKKGQAFPYGDLVLHSLPVRLRLREDVLLPPFKGSTFRGLLGHALIGSFCQAGREVCHGCSRSDICPYPSLFKPYLSREGRSVPAPYLVDPLYDPRTRIRKGEDVGFVLRLFGPALRWLPFVLAGLCRAGGKGGLGPRRAKFALVEPTPPPVATEPRAWGERAPEGLESTRAADLTGNEGAIRGIRFLTPLKLKEGGEVLGEVHERALLSALERRVKGLCKFYGEGTWDIPLEWEEAPVLRLGQGGLRWVVLERPSCTQPDRVNIGGWVGFLPVEGCNRSAASLLRVGQWTHIGKNTVYGCGKYTLLPTATDGA